MCSVYKSVLHTARLYKTCGREHRLFTAAVTRVCALHVLPYVCPVHTPSAAIPSSSRNITKYIILLRIRPNNSRVCVKLLEKTSCITFPAVLEFEGGGVRRAFVQNFFSIF